MALSVHQWVCAEYRSGRVGVGEQNQIQALQKIWSKHQYLSLQHTLGARLLQTKNSQILDVDIIS